MTLVAIPVTCKSYEQASQCHGEIMRSTVLPTMVTVFPGGVTDPALMAMYTCNTSQ